MRLHDPLGVRPNFSVGKNLGFVLDLFGTVLLVGPFAKGPSRTKNTTKSEFRSRVNFGMEVAKRYGEGSETLCFFVFLLGRCERVLRFMGREVQGR